MINNDERKLFWDTLKELHDDSQQSWDKLSSVYRPPNTLCRFRSVNESTLQQLQYNNLYFSSTDKYDDPFDTYFYINYAAVRNALLYLSNIKDNQQLLDILNNSNFSGYDDNFLDLIAKESKGRTFNSSEIEQKLAKVKQFIHERLFSICFCDNPLNETLWLKYADNHRGFVLNYEMNDPGVFECGKYDDCNNCMFKNNIPNIYPMYYSDERYDATRYAIGVQLINEINEKIPNLNEKFPYLITQIHNNLKWEIERISLIKKKCHENDREWRMLCPVIGCIRPKIKMKPSSIALGLRMPEYERRLVISAAKVANISSINQVYIDEMDNLQIKPVDM